jgi:hypothetical protein
MMMLTDLYEFKQIRFILTAEAAGLLENAELSIEYQKENLKHVEVWVRRAEDNVKGHIRTFEATNKDISSESFQQDLITQVNDLDDITAYIDAWIWRRHKEAKD